MDKNETWTVAFPCVWLQHHLENQRLISKSRLQNPRKSNALWDKDFMNDVLRGGVVLSTTTGIDRFPSKQPACLWAVTNVARRFLEEPESLTVMCRQSMKNPSCLTEPNTSRPTKKMNTAAPQPVHALASPAFNRIMHGNTTSLPAPSKWTCSGPYRRQECI